MRNIGLVYMITALRHTWFWLGTWAIYYSSFGGNYAIGLLETIMIVTSMLAEIPTGAIADLLGKRYTLILAFVVNGLANIWMGFAPNLLIMCISLALMNIGGAFASGSFEALIYDTLLENKKEEKYHRVLSNISAIRLFSLAIFGIIGGYIAITNIRLPYVLNGIGLVLAGFLSYFLVEPHVDSIKLSMKTYLKQNIDGVKHLFRSIKIRRIVIPALIVGSILLIFGEGLDDIMLLEYGFREKPFELGIIVSVGAFLASLVSYLSGRYLKKITIFNQYIFELILFTIILLLSPVLSMYFGAISIIIRTILKPLLDTHISVRINNSIKSEYRATSLSAFSMLQGLPYAMSILLISISTDMFSSKLIASVFGLIFLLLIFITLKIRSRSKLLKIK